MPNRQEAGWMAAPCSAAALQRLGGALRRLGAALLATFGQSSLALALQRRLLARRAHSRDRLRARSKEEQYFSRFAPCCHASPRACRNDSPDSAVLSTQQPPVDP